MRWSSLGAFGLVCSLGLLVSPLSVGQEAKAGGKTATLVVQLPHPKAKLTIDGAVTRQKGKTRRFTTPALEPGKQFTYTLVATWRSNDYTTTIRTKEVTVEAGKTAQADLRTEDPKQRDKIVVDFEPTPNNVVEAMCKLGLVGKNDVVYDLGCGDGRIVITAVKKFGAKRGVGIDINPERVKETKENARMAGLIDKVEARRINRAIASLPIALKADVADTVEARAGDVLKIADLSDATVVMLYLGRDVNLRLRPILQKTLKPGARIVSNHHDMGDWKPYRSQTVRGEDKLDYTIYLWRIEKKK